MPITVAILGRPNVGKSTLFNRLCGLRIALVDPMPGVTRDRRSGNASLGDLRFEIIDTAGLDDAEAGSMEASMQAQTGRALADADVGLMLIDARAGVTPMDRHFTDWLRKSSVPIILVANKCEGTATQSGLFEAFELGLGDPIALSAEHGEGMADLYEALAPYVDQKTSEEEAAAGEEEPDEKEVAGPLQLAIIGRPNVGKSTILNRLLGDERVITGPEPGVTRDAITVSWSWQGQEIKLIDTAGLRRRARIQKKIEKLSTADTIRAIRFSHVAVLVLDGTAMAERQDLTIADHVVHEGRALIIAVNKWDLVKDRKAAMQKLQDRLSISLPQLRGIPIVTISAKTGEGMGKLIPAVLKSFKVWNSRLPTGPLNRWLDDVLEHHPPPLARGRRIRLRYITQVKARPPTFLVFASRTADIPESYRRYLVNSLRETFSIDGVPIRLNFRSGKNPYVSDKDKR